jgi:hypothetical protein
VAVDQQEKVGFFVFSELLLSNLEPAAGKDLVLGDRQFNLYLELHHQLLDQVLHLRGRVVRDTEDDLFASCLSQTPAVMCQHRDVSDRDETLRH